VVDPLQEIIQVTGCMQTQQQMATNSPAKSTSYG